MIALRDEPLMTKPSRSRARAGPLRTQPSRAARLRSARAGHGAPSCGNARALPGQPHSSLYRAAGRAQSARLDYLARYGKTSFFSKAAQALHDLVIAQLFGGAAIVADHELAFVRMLDIAAGDERAR